MKPFKKEMENKTVLIWKMAIASAVSWVIAIWMGSAHPYLAPISVILCLQSTVKNSIRFSFHRIVGTIIGISVTVVIVPYLPVNGWTIGLLILLGSFIVKWLKRDESAIHQAALTILLVFVIGNKSGAYFHDRFRDTLIGALIAVLIHMFMFPPNFTKQAGQNFRHFSRQLTAAFIETADWLQNGLEKKTGYLLQLQVKQLLNDLHKTKEVIKEASDSLDFNPFSRKSQSKLKEYQRQMYILNQGYTFLSSAVGLLMAWGKEGTISPAEQLLWADQLRGLIPYFLEKQSPAGNKWPGESLNVAIPLGCREDQFHIALVLETEQLLTKISR